MFSIDFLSSCGGQRAKKPKQYANEEGKKAYGS